MKLQKPVYITIGLVFFILGISSKNYFYIISALLFIIAGFIQNKQNKS